MHLIIGCQSKLSELDETFENKKKILIICGTALIGSLIFLFFKITSVAFILFMVLLFIFSYYPIHKWHSSVRQLVGLLLYFNIIFGCLVIYELLLFLNHKGYFAIDNGFYIVFPIVYFILWYLISMIAKCEVAKLVNEFISAILTILFTAGTYISSIYLSTYPSIETIQRMYKNEQELEAALANGDEIISSILVSIVNYVLTKLYLFILPFLCVSLFSMASISVKQYWLKKNNKNEVWDDIQLSDERTKETDEQNS